MVQPVTKINDGAYMVLDTPHMLGCVVYDGRVANQTILLGQPDSLDEEQDEEE